MDKILIIEDESLIALDIKLKLKSFGFNDVEAVHTPEDAILCVENLRPSICLMDINLKSDMDGIDLAGVINASFDIPVVFLTSYSDMETIGRAKTAAPYGYLVKPIESQSLFSMVTMALNRAKLERSVREQNRLFESVLENSSDGIIVSDDECRIKYFNHVFMSIFDLEQGDIYGELLGDVLEKYVINYEELEDKCLGHGRYNIMAELHSGNIKPMLINVTSFNLSDDIERKLIFFTDLTELEQAKVALSESEKNFREIFEKNAEAIALIKRSDGKIYDINKSFENLFFIEKSEVSSKDYGDLKILSPLKKYLDNGESYFGSDVFEFINTKGDLFFARLGIQKMDTAEEKYFYINIKDVTEEKILKEREKLLQQKMIHANKMTALGTLVSGVAHEINNPNNFIMFNSQILLDMWKNIKEKLDQSYENEGDFEVGGLPYSNVKDDINKLLEGISSGSERIKKIVHELKDFARVDSEKADESVEMFAVINSSVKILKQHIYKYTTNFSVDIKEDVPFIKGNRQKLEQVVINLVLNAIESLQMKNAAVKILCYKDDVNKRVILKVVDEGSGMSEEVLNRITEPFYTTKQNEGGTGLGLSIVYSIIKEHNGELDIVSSVGVGTEVIISLPFME